LDRRGQRGGDPTPAKRPEDLFLLLVWETQGLADEDAFLLGELEEHGFVARLGFEVGDTCTDQAERKLHGRMARGLGFPTVQPLVETCTA
jgi:hypothetical protein